MPTEQPIMVTTWTDANGTHRVPTQRLSDTETTAEWVLRHLADIAAELGA